MPTPSIRTPNRHRASGLRDMECFGERHRLSGLGCAVFDGVGLPVRGGGVYLERKHLYPLEGPWIIVGFLPDDVLSGSVLIANQDTHPHTVSMGYWYRVRNLTGGGQTDERVLEPVRIDFDGAGARITAGLPHRPLAIFATALESGAFRITFDYRRWGQGADPTLFEVFEGTPTVDYGTPLTDPDTSLPHVVFDGETTHTFKTPTYADGTKHVFAARSVNAAGGELSKYETPLVVAQATGPPQPSYFLRTSEYTGSGGDHL